MRLRHRFSLLVALAAPLALGCAATDSPADAAPESCELAGCPWVFSLALDLPTTWETMRGSTVTVCRNGVCAAGSYSCLPESPGVDVGRACPLPTVDVGGTAVTVSAHVFVAADGTMYLHVTWDAYSPGDYTSPGDTYLVEVRDSAGAAIVDHTEVVGEYDVTWPNGLGCEPTCHEATFDRRATPAP
jgi:hypothetical protein